MGLFHKATKYQSKLRLAIAGPSGSGKTWSALSIAMGLLKPGERVALLDTERGSASKYAGDFDFDVAELTSYTTDDYLKAIAEAEAAGYGVIIVDSLSHAWSGPGGILEMVDRASEGKGGNWSGWKVATPVHNRFIDALLRAKAHVICTLRSKTDWVMETNDKGKVQPRKVGTEPIQRAGLDFEFDVFGEMDVINQLTITKTRCKALTGQQYLKPGADLAKILTDWLTDGAPALAVPEPQDASPAPTAQPAAEKAPAAQEPKAASTQPSPPMSARERIRASIHAARTLAALEALVPTIQRLPKVDQADLKSDYRKRQNELKAPAPQAPVVSIPDHAFVPPSEAAHSGLMPGEIRKALLAAASVSEAEALLAKADPEWDRDVLIDLRAECDEAIARLESPSTPPEPAPAPKADPPPKAEAPSKADPQPQQSAPKESEPEPAPAPIPAKEAVAEVRPEPAKTQPPPPPAEEEDEEEAAHRLLQAASVIEKKIPKATSFAEVAELRKEIEAGGFSESIISILLGECSGRDLHLKSLGVEDFAKKAADREALLARYRAEIAETASTGHPAKAVAARVNAARGAHSGELTKAEAAEIAKLADDAIAKCGAPERKGKARR